MVSQNHKHCVYVLENPKNGKYYIGCTTNLNQRLEYHNNGLSPYTRKFRPWQLKYVEKYSTLKEARTRESNLKQWKNRDRLDSLINN